MFKALFQSLPALPSTVTVVSQDKYTSRKHCRGNGIMLYSPQPSSRGFFSTNTEVFEVVLPRPVSESMDEAYSLYRTANETEATEIFSVYNDVIPQFVNITKKCSVQNIQEACDLMRNHRSWSLVHLLAHLGRPKLFEIPEIRSHINDVEDMNGMTPLMVAIQAGNLNMIQCLLALDCSLDSLAHNECSVLHFAASTNKDIINCLLTKEGARRWVNSFNGDGHTPLHLACLADQSDCVSALLIAGADANVSAAGDASRFASTSSSPVYVGDIVKNSGKAFHSEDMKYGGTPLHWCISKEVIEALLEAKCDIDARNLEGQTALHVMVSRNRLDCAVTLLYHGANASMPNLAGETPVHLAVKHKHVNILQALIVFGANVNVPNNKGETPRHLIYDLQNGAEKMTYMLHVAGAFRCSSSMAGCSLVCSHNGDFNGTPDTCVPATAASTLLEQMLTVAGMDKASTERRAVKGGRMLCLDGGGIRGLILIQILLELEAATQRPVVECFDWVAGTSTGGILALAMSLGKTMKECQRLYFKLKEKAFIGNRPYSSEGIEKILKDCVGPNTMMSDIKRPKLMITSVLASQKPLRLCIFRNYPSPTEIITSMDRNASVYPETGDERVWEVARSTSAAPSYFKSFKNYVDGGLISNNPTLDAMTEALEHQLALRAVSRPHQATPVSIVVSCGTGLVPCSKLKSLDLSWTKGFIETLMMASRLTEIGTLLVDLATCTDGRVVDRARAWCSMAGIPYYRFNPQMSEDVKMDETSNETIVKILWETKAYMFHNKGLVKEVANFILRDE